MEKNKKIILGTIIALVVIIGLIAVLGGFNSNSGDNSSDGLQTHQLNKFEFKAPEEFEYAKAISGTAGHLENANYSGFMISIDENIENLDMYTQGYNERTVDGITYKYDISGWEEGDGYNSASISAYFEKNGTIFSINVHPDESKVDQKTALSIIETIIKTMTPN